MKSRRERRAKERALKKLSSSLVCVWCGTSGGQCTVKSVDDIHCPECNDQTKLVKKHYYNQLNDEKE